MNHTPLTTTAAGSSSVAYHWITANIEPIVSAGGQQSNAAHLCLNSPESYDHISVSLERATFLGLKNNDQQRQHQQTSHYMTTIMGNKQSIGKTPAQQQTTTSSLWQFSEALLGPLRRADKEIDYYVNGIWKDRADERVLKLPFMSDGPWKLLLLIVLYVALVTRWGPSLMERRRPFELNWALRSYNLAMVGSNLWMCYHACRILNYGAQCFGCEVINGRDTSPDALELLRFGWIFYLSRLVEWIDTAFFVLRKKQTQITKLHVFHHSFVPMLVWSYLKFHPGKTVAFFPLVNSFVHTIMYTYYFLATFGPKMAPYLWWKRYLTSLQIVQFVVIIMQLLTIPLRETPQCQYPRLFFWLALAGAVLFLTLFYRYYIDTYKRNSQSQKKTKQLQQQPQQPTNLSNEKVPFVNSDPLLELSKSGRSQALAQSIDDAIDDHDLRQQRQYWSTSKNSTPKSVI